jgi:hypothetical protein
MSRRERRRSRQDADRKTLTELATRFGTDKWGSHYYTQHYETHLARFRDEKFQLLEIGVGGYNEEGLGGASLHMWRAYFPKARIVGVDIEDKSFVDTDRIRTVIGDQTDAELLREQILHGLPTLVFIDDGSHRPADIIRTFSVAFPMLPDGAIYAIEDIQTSYWPEFGGHEDLNDPTTSIALVKRLVDGLNYEEFLDEDYRPTYFDQHVKAVHCYHNLVVIEKGDNQEGTNKRDVLGVRYGTNDPADGEPVGSESAEA